VRTLVWWCPDWPVVAVGAGPDEPAAVVRANRVLAATPGARAEGVVPGQRRREAQGRCPGLAVLERDEGREARLFEPVVRALEAFTPRLELARPGRCAFATRGPSRYFGGDASLTVQVGAAADEALESSGWAGHGRVGVADGPFAATLAARLADAAGPGRAAVLVVEPGESAVFLAPRPVVVLGRPALADVLVRLGLSSLGEFAALPTADVVARFGADGAAAHRLARGLDERPPAVVDPPPDLVVAIELDPPAERVDTAAFVGKSLADDLFDRLDGAGLSCTRLRIDAETEHGESLSRYWRHEGALTPGAVADRVRWQLDGWLNGSAALRPTAGVSRLALVPDEVAPARGRQLGFWGGETAAAERVARALARVQGLLGPDAVTVPERRGGRGPAEQVDRVPVHAVDLTAPRRGAHPTAAEPWPGRVPLPAPAAVPLAPVPADVVDAHDRPVAVDGRGQASAAPARLRVGEGPWLAVEAWAGPWPADERWWDPPTRRRRARFQVVAGGRGHLLAREGGRWWLEGRYD